MICIPLFAFSALLLLLLFRFLACSQKIFHVINHSFAREFEVGFSSPLGFSAGVLDHPLPIFSSCRWSSFLISFLGFACFKGILV